MSEKFIPDSELNDVRAEAEFDRRYASMGSEILKEWTDAGFTPTQAAEWLQEGYLTPGSAREEINKSMALAKSILGRPS